MNVPERAKGRYERSARHRPGCRGNKLLFSSYIVITCPQKMKKSDALITYSAIHYMAYSVYLIISHITSRFHMPSIVGSCMTSVALAVVGTGGVAMLRCCGAAELRSAKISSPKARI